MLKSLSTESVKLRKSGAGVSVKSRAGRDRSELNKSEMDNVEVNSGKIKENRVGKKA